MASKRKELVECGRRNEALEEFEDGIQLIGDCDRISLSSSKSRESLASNASRSTMSSVEHRPRSSTGISKSVDRGNFLRPKTLAIQTGFSKIWRKERSGESTVHHPLSEMLGTSCPGPSASTPVIRTKKERKSLPMIRYDYTSAPATLSSYKGTLMKKHLHHVSSEIIPEIDQAKQKSGSHLSLSIGNCNEKPHHQSSYSRSPKSISRFLRTSFAKLMSIKTGNAYDDADDHSETALVRSRSFSPDSKDDMPQTPSTLAYIEETKLSGLPVIPFAYPTCVIVEKMKSKTKEWVRCESEELLSPEPPRKASALYNFDEAFQLDPMVAHSPLEDLVGMALREFNEEEALCGSVVSPSGNFDLYNQHYKPRRPVNQLKSTVRSKQNEAELFSDFHIEDELNLCDPTKSSWRREVIPIPLSPPENKRPQTGPYLDMSSSHMSPKYCRSRAVPIGNSFAIGHSSSMR